MSLISAEKPSLSGLLFASATALTSGLFHAFHNVAEGKYWGINNPNDTYIGLKMLHCDEFMQRKIINIPNFVEDIIFHFTAQKIFDIKEPQAPHFRLVKTLEIP